MNGVVVEVVQGFEAVVAHHVGLLDHRRGDGAALNPNPINDEEIMIEDTTNPSFAVGQGGTGHGVWEYKGEHKFAVKSIAFINFTTTPPPPPGFKAGTQTITQMIEFQNGPDEWTADAQVHFADTTGAVYRSARATASAVRLE